MVKKHKTLQTCTTCKPAQSPNRTTNKLQACQAKKHHKLQTQQAKLAQITQPVSKTAINPSLLEKNCKPNKPVENHTNSTSQTCINSKPVKLQAQNLSNYKIPKTCQAAKTTCTSSTTTSKACQACYQKSCIA